MVEGKEEHAWRRSCLPCSGTSLSTDHAKGWSIKHGSWRIDLKLCMWYIHPNTVLSPTSFKHLVQFSIIFSLPNKGKHTAMCNFTHLKSHWHDFWNNTATGNMEKWCKGDQTWGFVKEKPPVLTLRNKIKCNQWCLQKCVFCFTWQHLLPKPFLLHYYKFIWMVYKAERLASSQCTASCCWLATEPFFFPHQFSQSVFWNLSGWIKIDQGLLLLINSMLWLHFTKIQTLWQPEPTL